MPQQSPNTSKKPSWPALVDYQSSLQHPSICFQDVKLKQGTPKTNNMGLPHLVSGQFASVCRINCGNERFAVRVFQKEIPARRSRYEKISSYLNSARSKTRSPFPFVSFDYHDQGIRIKGAWYPILVMEWVEGSPLHTTLDRYLSSGDKTKVTRLSDQWGELLETLEVVDIAHGDLQHGNVLVAEGRPLLVDYDGMFVPAFEGQQSLELGLPPYQHPERNENDFGMGLDNFAGLVIHLSLRALIEQPSLWGKYYNTENLLFVKEDFRNPARSDLFRDLRKLPDPEIRDWVGLLESWCAGPHFPARTIRKKKTPEEEALETFVQMWRQGSAPDLLVTQWDQGGLARYGKAQPYHNVYVTAQLQVKNQFLQLFKDGIREGKDPKTLVALWEKHNLTQHPAAAPFIPLYEEQKAKALGGPQQMALDQFRASHQKGATAYELIRIWKDHKLDLYPPAQAFQGIYVKAKKDEALRLFQAAINKGQDAEAVYHWQEGGLDIYLPAGPYRPMFEAAKRRLKT